jgi:hypothetical protein
LLGVRNAENNDPGLQEQIFGVLQQENTVTINEKFRSFAICSVVLEIDVE